MKLFNEKNTNIWTRFFRKNSCSCLYISDLMHIVSFASETAEIVICIEQSRGYCSESEVLFSVIHFSHVSTWINKHLIIIFTLLMNQLACEIFTDSSKKKDILTTLKIHFINLQYICLTFSFQQKETKNINFSS